MRSTDADPADSSRRAPAVAVAALVCIAADAGRGQHHRRALLCGAARSDRRAALHPVARHPAHPGQDRRADHLALLLFDAARRRGAGLRRLCPARARDARPICRRGARQDPPRNLQSRAVLRCRGPRGRLRAAGRAAQPGGEQVYFGLAGDQLDRRSADHRVLLARARALSRIRSDQAGPQPRLPEEDRDRAADQRCRSKAT